MAIHIIFMAIHGALMVIRVKTIRLIRCFLNIFMYSAYDYLVGLLTLADDVDAIH